MKETNRRTDNLVLRSRIDDFNLGFSKAMKVMQMGNRHHLLLNATSLGTW